MTRARIEYVASSDKTSVLFQKALAEVAFNSIAYLFCKYDSHNCYEYLCEDIKFPSL